MSAAMRAGSRNGSPPCRPAGCTTSGNDGREASACGRGTNAAPGGVPKSGSRGLGTGLLNSGASLPEFGLGFGYRFNLPGCGVGVVLSGVGEPGLLNVGLVFWG